MRKLLQLPKVQVFGLLLLILLLVVPYLCVVFYTFPYADDYAMHLERVDYLTKTGQADNLVSCFTQMVYSTFTYGHGFGHVWNSILSPMKSDSLLLIRSYLFAYLLFFFLSVFAFASTITYRFLQKKRMSVTTLILSAFILMLFLGMRFYPEIYFWFTTTEFYLYTFSMILLSSVFLVEYVEAPHWGKLVLASITAFAAGCGPTNIGTFCCFALLSIALYGILSRKRSWVVAIPLLCAAGVTLLYLLLPGAMHRMGDRSLNFGSALIYDAVNVGKRVAKLMVRSWFPVVLVIFGIYSWNHFPIQSKSRFWDHPVLMLVALGTVCFVITYPVALGYAAYYPNRSEFVTDASIYFTSLFYVLYLVHYFRRKEKLVRYKSFAFRALAVLSVLFMAVSAFYITPIREQPVVAVYDELLSGTLASNEAYWEGYLDSLKAKQGMDVEVPLPDDLTSRFLTYQQILPDPAHWVNVAMARYYGLKSMRQDVNCGKVYIRSK